MPTTMNNPQIVDVSEFRYGRPVFEMREDLVIRQTDKYGRLIVAFTVPAGFRSDGASVPWLFWWFMPPRGDHTRAAILHDYFCDHPEVCRQRTADALFVEMLVHLGVPIWRRVPAYLAVRIYQVFAKYWRLLINKLKGG